MVSRREFVVGALPWLAGTAAGQDASPVRWRAAVIGHTGRGDYGHGHDLALRHRTDVRVVAVADANESGLTREVEKLGEVEGFADYNEMLARVRPQLVVVAPRHADQHHAMALAALQAGAHVYAEKPFTTTLAEADELLATARTRGLTLTVAHQMRLQPDVVALKNHWDAGEFGDLVSLHAWGKQDSRAGGEDLMVLGTHLFDLMRLFAGGVEWVSARVRQQGRPITTADARTPKDNVGLVAGDEIFAQMSFADGGFGTFTSHAGLRESTGRWGLELRGSKRSARLCTDIPTEVFELDSTGWTADGRTDAWKKPSWASPKPADPFADANRRVADDWLAAITEQRSPRCSGANAAQAIELVMAVYESALTGTRVRLPMTRRTHPLAR